MICTPRISGFGNARAARSIRPVRPRIRKITPIRSAPAAISSDPRPFAIAIAPNAFSGWTGIGSPYTSATVTYRSPAGSSTAVADSPFATISATAIGSRTPMSATAPAISRVPKWMPFPRSIVGTLP